MRKLRGYVMIAIPVIVILVIVGGVILFFNRQLEPATLARNRDMAIIFSSMMVALGMLLFSILLVVVIWILFLVKDQVIPLLETTNQTVNKIKETTEVVSENVVDTTARVKNTTDFVTEEVAAPLIKAYGLVSQGRAFVRVVTGRNPRPEGSPLSRAFTKEE